MNELCAQGDLLIERVPDIPLTGIEFKSSADGALVLAEGEVTGHRHAIYGPATLFRDDNLARDIPDGLYIGHLKVGAPVATLVHDEHAPIELVQGTYRVRRQREVEPQDVQFVVD